MKSHKKETRGKITRDAEKGMFRPWSRRLLTVLAAMSIIGTSTAEEIFIEEWKEDMVGDQLHQLFNWEKIAGDDSNTSIVDPADTDRADNFLRTVSTNNGLRICTAVELGLPEMLTIELETAITNPGVPAGEGVYGELLFFVMARKPDGTWGDLAYGIYLKPGVESNQLQIRKGGGSPLHNVTFAAGSDLNVLRLEIDTTNSAETTVTVFANGMEVGSVIDDTPFAMGTDFKLWLEVKNGLTADVFKLGAAAIPRVGSLPGFMRLASENSLWWLDNMVSDCALACRTHTYNTSINEK